MRQELEKQKARYPGGGNAQPSRGRHPLQSRLLWLHGSHTGTAILFVNQEQVSQDVRTQLWQEVQLRPYDAFIPNLKELGAEL